MSLSHYSVPACSDRSDSACSSLNAHCPHQLLWLTWAMHCSAMLAETVHSVVDTLNQVQFQRNPKTEWHPAAYLPQCCIAHARSSQPGLEAGTSCACLTAHSAEFSGPLPGMAA